MITEEKKEKKRRSLLNKRKEDAFSLTAAIGMPSNVQTKDAETKGKKRSEGETKKVRVSQTSDASPKRAKKTKSGKKPS